MVFGFQGGAATAVIRWCVKWASTNRESRELKKVRS
jgi:hypothetical protein